MASEARISGELGEKRVRPEAVMAMVLLKAHLEGKPLDIDDISGLFFYDQTIRSLAADGVALRRVPSGGVPGKGVYSEDVDQFVSRFCAVGYARMGENGSIELLQDSRRICFLILWDEAKDNPTGLEILAGALNFRIAELLHYLKEVIDPGTRISDFLSRVDDEWLGVPKEWHRR